MVGHIVYKGGIKIYMNDGRMKDHDIIINT